ncbi:MAG: translocation/assembly module TamB domain-containing protein [Bryobacteraceae bacterium]
MKRPVRIALLSAASLAGLVIVIVIAAALIARSGWFHEQVRRRIVAEIERSTGGSVAIGSFSFDWRTLRAEVRDLVIRGTEPPGAAPLARIRSIVVGLRVISVLKRQVDLASLDVTEPSIHLIVKPDGTTNVPEPKVKREPPDRTAAEIILDLKIGRFAITGGAVHLEDSRTPLDARGEKLRVQFSYSAAGPRYDGTIRIEPLHLAFGKLDPFDAQIDLALAIQKNRLDASRLLVQIEGARVEASGSIEDFTTPRTTFRFHGSTDAARVARLFRSGLVRRGSVEFDGTASWSRATSYAVSAKLRGRALGIRYARYYVQDVAMSAAVDFDPRSLRLRSVEVSAPGGGFRGDASIEQFDRFQVEGELRNLAIPQLLATFAPSPQQRPWDGSVSGPVRLSGRIGSTAVIAETRLAITPGAGPVPLTGVIDARYDGRARTLALGRSHLAVGSTRLSLTGAAGSELRVHFESANLDDLLPAINAVSSTPLATMPVRLDNGNATFDGVVTGNLDSLAVNGKVAATGLVWNGQRADRLSTSVAATSALARFENLDLQITRPQAGSASVRGTGSIELVNWKPEPAGAVRANLNISTGRVELAEVKGSVQAATIIATVSGAIGNPAGQADVTLQRGSLYGEAFDRITSRVRYTGKQIELQDVEVAAAGARLNGSAVFDHPPNNFSTGRLHFTAATTQIEIQRLATVREYRAGLTGTLRADAKGEIDVDRSTVRPVSLAGTLTAQNLQLNTQPIGKLFLVATTVDRQLDIRLQSDFLNTELTGTGRWRIEPGYPGHAEVAFSRVSFASIRDWFAGAEAKPASAAPFDGTAEGTISVDGPAFDPLQWKAALHATRIELYPLQDGAPADRFAIRNQGPVDATLERSVVRIASARFAGPSTNLEASGSVNLQSQDLQKSILDVRLQGAADLRVLAMFDSDINSSGAVSINASARGAVRQPQLSGRLDLKGAGFFYGDFTTGLANGNGAILFSGRQANIQDLKGEVGGGKVSAGGFVGFGDELTYRLTLNASQVRVRYPEGVSTTADAALNLTGAARNSVLSGSVTILRTGFNPRTDLSSILAKTAEPVKTPSARTGFLGGIHLDVQIETSPTISFESPLAQDIQAEAELRLRGTPYNPVLLGRVVITQGELVFFGTKYTINQGSINFQNPVRIEPVLNLDLETKVRGIDVILTISGPINKLNLTHRADPPMEFSEMLALLATGRAPTSDPTIAARSAAQPDSFAQLGASAIVGQAIANPLSNRLQRFFGVSRLKIDPRFTGVESTPQARLTLEQQITRDLTFTYITNLTRSNPEVVRVEWSLSKQYSLLAIREENGVFGLDFLYKKSFK